jgi:hypothetical protein
MKCVEPRLNPPPKRIGSEELWRHQGRKFPTLSGQAILTAYWHVVGNGLSDPRRQFEPMPHAVNLRRPLE